MGIFLDYVKNKDDNKTPANAAGVSHINPFENTINKYRNNSLSKTIDFLKSDTGVNNTNLTRDLEKDMRDEIIANNINTEEELNKVKAENQSAFEQLGNLAVQAVGSEVVVGTALGLSNLVDMAINFTTPKGEDDYSNPVSKYLEDIQNDIKNRFEIYRQDPNATWAIGDFGWWADNAVSIASTASMLLPTLAVTKGVRLVGKGINTLAKGTKLAKAGVIAKKGIINMANKAGIARPSTLAKQINLEIETITDALLNRTMEGYLEARDVYNTVYERILLKIKELDNNDRNKLFINNPDLLKPDMSDEEIASRIASVSADETFKNDYAMLLFDIVQFKALGSLWKGFNNIATAGARILNRNAIKNLTKEGKDALESVGFIAKQKEAIRHIFRNPLTSLTAVQWTEGIEEGYQGIQVEKGKEVAEKILNPNFKGRTLDSYLTDGAIWEQAFWGVIGGAGFQAFGNGLGKLKKVITKEWDKKHLSEQDYNLKHTAYENIVKNEITSREEKMKTFSEQINQLNALKNPYYDSQNPLSKEIPKELTREQAEVMKEELIDDFVTDMVLNSADAGTWDLLKEFVSSKEFAQYFKDNKTISSQSEEAFAKSILTKMDDIYEKYNNSMETIFNSIDVESPYVASLFARDIVKRKNKIEHLTNIKNKLEDEINQKYPINDNSYHYKQMKLVSYIKDELKKLDNTESYFKNQLNNKNISKQAFDIYIDSINKERQRLQKFAGQNLTDTFSTTNISEIDYFISRINEFADSILNPQKLFGEAYTNPPVEEMNLIDEVIEFDNEIDKINYSMPISQKDYQSTYDDFALANDSNVIKKYNDASQRVTEWIESQEDLNKAKEDVLTGNVPNNLQEDLKILKLGHHTTSNYLKAVNDVIGIVKEDRNKKSEEAKTGDINGTKMSEQATDTVRNDTEKNDDRNETNTPPSTGEESQIDDKKFDDTQAGILTEEDIKEVNDIIKRREEEDLAQRAVSEEYDINRIIKIRNAVYSIDNLDKQSLINKNNNSQEVIDVRNKIKEKLINDGILNITDEEINDELLPLISKLNKKYGNTNEDKIEKQIDDTINYAITNNLEGDKLADQLNNLLDLYIFAQTGTKVNKDKDYRTLIDIQKLFAYLLNPNKPIIDVKTAKILYNYLANYIQQKDINSNYTFKNISMLRNMNLFVNNLAQETTSKKELTKYLHLVTSNRNRTKVQNEFLNNFQKDSELEAQIIEYSKGYKNISFTYKGEEIGFIALVESNKNGTTFKLKYNPRTGFRYNIDKNNNSNTDDFFRDLIYGSTSNYKKLLEYIIKDYVSKNSTDGASSAALTQEEILESANIANGLLKDIHAFSKVDQYNVLKLFKDIQNILFYSGNLIPTSEWSDTYKELAWYEYKDWIAKVYNNYSNTYSIQERLKNNKKVKIKLAGVSSHTVLYGNKQRNIGDKELKFDHTKHKIIINDNNNYISEDGKNYNGAKNKFQPGFMGFILQDNPNAPIVAAFTSGNKVKDNANYKKKVKDEIINLLSNYQNGNISYNDLYKYLVDLLNSNNSKKHNLFEGYNVVNLKDKDGKNDRIVLNLNNTKNYPLIIYKYISKKSSEEGTFITYMPNGSNIGKKTFDTADSNTIEKIADEIVNNLKFNRSFYPISLRDVHDNSNDSDRNNYIYKKDGKLVINIGKEEVYDSFGEFVIKQNAFKTNQELNEVGGYFNLDKAAESIYVDVDTINVLSEDVKSVKTPQDIIKSDKGKGINTKDLLDASNMTQEEKDILIGDNEGDLNFIGNTVYYDGQSRTDNAKAYHKSGKIFITKKGSEEINNRYSLIRLLTHENIHRKINELKLFEKREIVDEILDTYRQFINTLNNDNSDEANKIKQWLVKNNFNPIDYFNQLSEDWNDRSQEEKDAYFAEEWLAESLSQAELINYLNTHNYKESIRINEDEDNKSIFQKIIELLLKLFGKTTKNLNKSSILAKQYQILGNGFNVETSTDNNVIIDENVNDKGPGESEINTIEKPQRRPRVKDTEQFAVTSDISNVNEININSHNETTNFDAFGVNNIKDMDSYIQQFPIQDRAVIAQMVADNQLIFVC